MISSRAMPYRGRLAGPALVLGLVTAITINLAQAAAVARRAAEAPSSHLLEIARSGSFRTSLKSDGSPQTSADTMAERLVRQTSPGERLSGRCSRPRGGGGRDGVKAQCGAGSSIPSTAPWPFARDIPVWGTLVALQRVENRMCGGGAPSGSRVRMRPSGPGREVVPGATASASMFPPPRNSPGRRWRQVSSGSSGRVASNTLSGSLVDAVG